MCGQHDIRNAVVLFLQYVQSSVLRWDFLSTGILYSRKQGHSSVGPSFCWSYNMLSIEFLYVQYWCWINLAAKLHWCCTYKLLYLNGVTLHWKLLRALDDNFQVHFKSSHFNIICSRFESHLQQSWSISIH